MNLFPTLRRLGPLALLLAGFASHAQTLSCPQPGQLRQVNACPTEEQMRAHFIGFCSENNNAYQGKTGPCTDYQEFRRLKNTALWESADGAFDGYRSCETGTSAPAGLSGVRVEKKGAITAVVCQYGSDTQTHRTRKACSLPPSCASDPAQCQVVCQ